MPLGMETPSLDAEAIDRYHARLDEPDWLREIRLEAWRRYEATPMPDRTDELWRRTDLSRLDMERIRPTNLSRLDLELGFASPEEDPRHYMELRDGLTRKGVTFGPFSSAVANVPDAFGPFLRGEIDFPSASGGPSMVGSIPADAGKFEVLTRAIGAEGYAVHVPTGSDVAVPLRARILAFEEDAGPDGREAATALEGRLESLNPAAVVFPRSVVVAGEGSRVLVIEDLRSMNGIGPYASLGLTEVYVGRNAEVTIVSMHDYAESAWDFHTQRSYVETDGRITTLTVHLGGGVTKSNVEGVLIGSNATSRMLGILFGDREQHFDLYTLQDHQAPHTTSNLLFKSALRGESKSVYSGLIRVDEAVTGADAYQANRNLLLSDSAKADSRPMLEILNNDVRCTHGATMGPVDPEQLFYLRSRGLDSAIAERMVVQGFFEEALDPIRDESTRAWLHDRIAEKIDSTP